jgi:hypothetical protein
MAGRRRRRTTDGHAAKVASFIATTLQSRGLTVVDLVGARRSDPSPPTGMI